MAREKTASLSFAGRIAAALLCMLLALAGLAALPGCAFGGSSGGGAIASGDSSGGNVPGASTDAGGSDRGGAATGGPGGSAVSGTSTDASGSSGGSTAATDGPSKGSATATIAENGSYTSKDEVALYIHTYGHLPGNFISKTKARNAGWNSETGNLADVLPGMSIGGSRFYNDEGKLPDKKGRTWTECDINYTSGYRGSERIVFSNDGLIYYTGDHYKTFERLY